MSSELDELGEELKQLSEDIQMKVSRTVSSVKTKLDRENYQPSIRAAASDVLHAVEERSKKVIEEALIPILYEGQKHVGALEDASQFIGPNYNKSSNPASAKKKTAGSSYKKKRGKIPANITDVIREYALSHRTTRNNAYEVLSEKYNGIKKGRVSSVLSTLLSEGKLKVAEGTRPKVYEPK